jgi:hypothetical protein
MRLARLRPLHHADDRGDIILGWLTKLTVVLAIAGIGLFEAISIGSTMASVSDDGSYAALEASSTWDDTKNLQQTYDAAVTAAAEQNAQDRVLVKGFTVDPDGTVHLRIARTARTLLLYRWSKTEPWTHVVRDAQGKSVGN